MQQSEQLIRNLLAYADIEVNGTRAWDLQVHDKRLFSRLLKQPELGLGESYMEGWWDSRAVDQFIYRLLQADLDQKIKKNWQLIAKLLLSRLINLQSQSRSRKVADVHYNLDNELYRYMLGPSMAYTCAYFKGTESLDVAQDQKYDLICRKLNLHAGEKILEVGCGFGGFAEFAAKHYACEVVAVNISTEQLAYARARCKDLPVSFYLCDYRNHSLYNPKKELFDKIVSIGMCEHVGYKNYTSWLRLMAQQLKPEGLFLLHTIGGNVSTTQCEPWTRKYIFPNGMLPSIAQLGKAMEGVFVMEDWHNFGAYYDKTLMAWQHNVDQHWSQLKHRFDERFYRMWNYYLFSCAGMFRARSAQLWQIVLSKGKVPGVYETVR